MKRHTVKIEPHNPVWPVLAEQIRHEILTVTTGLIEDIQHVGSTAVCDLPAKPILDIACALPDDPDIPALISKFELLGYIYRGDYFDVNGGYLFVYEIEPEIRSVHIHLVTRGSKQWKNYLRFRDTLRNNAIIRERYATLKKSLSQIYADDRQSYTASKNAFIKSILKEVDGSLSTTS